MDVIVLVLAIIGAIRVVDFLCAVSKFLMWNFVWPKKEALWSTDDEELWERSSAFSLFLGWLDWKLL